MYADEVFALAKKEYPWLEKWDYDALLKSRNIVLPIGPAPQNTTGAKELQFYQDELTKTQEEYNEFMWPRRFAECISVEETIQKMKKR